VSSPPKLFIPSHGDPDIVPVATALRFGAAQHPLVLLHSPDIKTAAPSWETQIVRADATNQCRSFGGSIAMRGGETLPPTGIATNRGPLRFPPSMICFGADQRPFHRRFGAILLGCAGLSSRKLCSRATRGKQRGRFGAGALLTPR
jgi:hypothetical protein